MSTPLRLGSQPGKPNTLCSRSFLKGSTGDLLGYDLFAIRNYNILPTKELHRTLQVDSTYKEEGVRRMGCIPLNPGSFGKAQGGDTLAVHPESQFPA